MEARGFFTEIDHEEAGSLRYPTASYKFRGTSWVGQRGAPLLGQHNEVVYCERLGYDKQDLVKLRESGVI